MDDNKPVLLTLHEALRLDLIEAYMAGEITLAEVAESMELTRRQCSRLIKRYRELGSAGLVSRRRGKPGNHQLNTTIRDQALQLIRSRGRDMNPSAIWRILTTEYGVRISKETVRKLMIAEKTGNHVLPPKPDSTLKRHCPDSPLTSGQLCFQHDISTLARQALLEPFSNVTFGAADVFLGCYVVIPRCCRYFTGLIAPNDSLIRFSLYQRMYLSRK